MDSSLTPGNPIRKHFPLIHEYGDTLTYLDNAATTQKPEVVIEAMAEYYRHSNANIHRGAYNLSGRATEAYEAVRLQVRDFIGAESEKEIVFVRGTTEAVNLVADAYLRDRLRPGEEVVVSAMEHHANLLPWQQLCREKHARLRIIPVNELGELDMQAYEDMLSPSTRFVSVVHISNTLGTVNPVGEIVRLAHRQGVPVMVDAAQSMAHYPVNVQEWDCDFLAFSGHKMLGPTGIGVLYGKQEYLEAMRPYQYGGEMIRSVTFEEASFAPIPHRFEAGTPHIAGVMGLGAAITFLNQVGKANIQRHLKMLLDYAHPRLEAIEGLRIIGNAKDKSGIISFYLDPIHPHDLATLLNEDGVAIRAGHHCTQPLMQLLGLPGTARVSFSVYNTTEEVDRLLEALHKAKTIPW